jgi:DNA-binding SARP family transcriptional activator/DNA-binding CsgD family transcriptional regulator
MLEILLTARGDWVPGDRLAELLWGHELPQNAAGSLQTITSVLRRHLVPDRELARALLVTEAEAYRFATELVEFDLDRFDELLERSAREPTHLARRSLERALSLVRGVVLEDEPHALWAEELRRTYRGRVVGAHLEAADAALAVLEHAAALAHAEAAAALDRFCERPHRTAMLALYALGRQHEALDRHRRFRAILDEELGLDPNPATCALESAILRHEDVRSLLPLPVRRFPEHAGERTIRLLGRTSELETLEHAARQVFESSFALLQIEGETGLGKTRLLDELATSLAGVRIGRATCSALEQHLPYVPLAAALRDALRGIELDGHRLPPLRRILPELRLSDPAQEFPEVDALEALVELVAEHAPLVLLLDDLHWADPHTLAALSYLQRRGARIPAGVVTTVRSELTLPDHPVRRLRPDVVVRLQPLSAAELEPLVIPDLHDFTDGNPRFVLEAIANGHRAEPSEAFADTLLAQCRAEGASAYRILLTASALEQPFEPEPLATVLQIDTAELVDELERLCERRILRIDGPRFRFRYQLVRNVLLAKLSPARRRLLRVRLHALDAPRSAQTHGPTQPEELRGRRARVPEGAAEHTVARSCAPATAGPVVPLTDRELEVLHHVAAGKRNREIASELYVTRDTVKKHVTHILDKLGAVSRTHAAALAREIGLFG